MSATRLAKISLTASIGFYMFLVVFNNLTDYDANFAFVSNVLSMSDTFSEEPTWRALSSPSIHHILYAGIILTEFSICVLCFWGLRNMWKNRWEDVQTFKEAKTFAIYGITLGVVLWFVGFISVGGEFFLMWQSETWNGIATAFRNSIFFTLVLIFVSGRED